MTEDQIERIVERQMNALDKSLMKGTISQEEYDEEVFQLESEARAHYKEIDRNQTQRYYEDNF